MSIDWRDILVPSSSLPEIALRGTLVYLVLFSALRFFLKRNAGQLGVADLLVIMLIAEVSQNALVGGARSVPEAALAVGIILFWTYALNWLSFHVPALARLTGSEALPIIENGRLNRRNMTRQLITYDELMSQMREQGIDEIAKVRSAFLEADGNFSFLRQDGGEVAGPPAKTAA